MSIVASISLRRVSIANSILTEIFFLEDAIKPLISAGRSNYKSLRFGYSFVSKRSLLSNTESVILNQYSAGYK